MQSSNLRQVKWEHKCKPSNYLNSQRRRIHPCFSGPLRKSHVKSVNTYWACSMCKLINANVYITCKVYLQYMYNIINIYTKYLHYCMTQKDVPQPLGLSAEDMKRDLSSPMWDGPIGPCSTPSHYKTPMRIIGQRVNSGSESEVFCEEQGPKPNTVKLDSCFSNCSIWNN